MTMTFPTRHFWKSHLSVPFVLYLAVRFPFTDKTVFHETTSSRAGGRILYRLLGFFGFRFVQMEFSLARRDKGGTCLTHRLETLLLGSCDHVLFDLRRDSSWVPDALRGEEDIVFRMIAGRYLQYSREFIAPQVFAEHYYTENPGELSACRPRVYLALPILRRKACAYLTQAASGGIVTRGWATLTNLRNTTYFLPHGPRYWINRFLASFHDRRPVVRNEIPARALAAGTVLQQAVSPGYLRFPTHSHFAWIRHFGIDTRRVVVFFSRKETPFDDFFLSATRALGLSFIDVTQVVDLIPNCFATLATIARENLRRVRPLRFEGRLWLWTTLTRYALLVEANRRMVRLCNAKAMHPSLEMQPEATALSLAMRLEGGESFWNVWSMYSYPWAQNAAGYEGVLIAWGDDHYGWLQSQGSRFNACFIAGIVCGDGHNGGEEAEARGLRDRFAGAGVKKIITAFDHTYGPLTSVDKAHMVTFLEVVLDVLDHHPDVGVLIKQKRESGLLNLLNNADRDRFEHYLVVGRLIVPPPMTRISVATMAADFAICCQIGSAAAIAGATGKAVIALDQAGLTHNPIALSPVARETVYTDRDQFTQAIRSLLDSPTELGQAQRPTFSLYDPFGDFHGNHRLGWIIGRYLTNRETEEDSKVALAEVIAAYNDKWPGHRAFSLETRWATPALEIWEKSVDELYGADLIARWRAP